MKVNLASKGAIVLAAHLCAFHASARAQETVDPPQIAVADVLSVAQASGSSSNSRPDQISAIVVSGNTAIEDDRIQNAIEPFFGEPLTDEVLERLNDELVQLALEEGFPYAQTTLDQDAAAMGIIQMSIDEGRIDAIQIDGFENAAALATLQRLIGKPARNSDLEAALLLVSDIPAVILRGAKLRRIEGRGVLIVDLDERDWDGRLTIDNYGTETFGPIRARVSTRLSNVLTSSDEIRTSVRINPIEPSELLFASFSYETRLAADGIALKLDGGLGRTAPGGQLDGADISGDTRSVGAGISAPIKRSKSGSIWLEGQLAYIAIEQDDLGAMLRDDTVVSASVGLRTRFDVAGGWARTGVWIERGLDVFGATREGDLFASRFDGDGVFTKFSFSVDTRLPLAKRLDVYLSASGQLADRPLLASEELSLGGPYRVRGYDFAEVLGDEGVYGLAELRYRVNTRDLPFDFLQFYGFVDGGYVSDIDRTGGEGSLFSAGPGVRARFGAIDLEAESAFPLGGSGERRTGNDPEFNIRAGYRF